nr:uncharacterized protein LOC108173315 isoform X2 [Malus domestica]
MDREREREREGRKHGCVHFLGLTGYSTGLLRREWLREIKHKHTHQTMHSQSRRQKTIIEFGLLSQHHHLLLQLLLMQRFSAMTFESKFWCILATH